MTPTMPSSVQISYEIPDHLKLALADAVIVYGRIEQELIEILWILENADLNRRTKIAKRPTLYNLLDLIESIEKAFPGNALEDIKKSAHQLSEERNLMVHGKWTMADEKPWVVWHKFIEDEDSIAGEFFEENRFKRFMKKGEHILCVLQTFHNQLELQTGVRTTSLPRPYR